MPFLTITNAYLKIINCHFNQKSAETQKVVPGICLTVPFGCLTSFFCAGSAAIAVRSRGFIMVICYVS